MLNRRDWAQLCFFMLASAVIPGCAKTPTQAEGSGARERAEEYYAAIAAQDWPSAYATLHPDSQKRYTLKEFSQLGQQYRRGLGFELQSVIVRACDERETDAIAHVTLSGRNAVGQRQYRDAVSLRRDDVGWRIVLSPRFGQPAGR